MQRVHVPSERKRQSSGAFQPTSRSGTPSNDALRTCFETNNEPHRHDDQIAQKHDKNATIVPAYASIRIRFSCRFDIIIGCPAPRSAAADALFCTPERSTQRKRQSKLRIEPDNTSRNQRRPTRIEMNQRSSIWQGKSVPLLAEPTEAD